MQPLENKEGANSASLEISKGCEIVLKYVEALMALVVTNVHCRDWFCAAVGSWNCFLFWSFFFFFSVCFGFPNLLCILFSH